MRGKALSDFKMRLHFSAHITKVYKICKLHRAILIEIINNTREDIEVKFGSAAIGGQIQVPDVHSFTMSQAKKSF